MMTVVIGAVLNILLDPLFIFKLGMGVRGAALATVISQAVSAVWVMLFLSGRKTVLRIRKRYIKPDAKTVGAIMALGISPFIMQSTESLVNVVFNSTLQRCGGDTAVGAMTIITSVMQFSLMPLQGLTQGAQPITSFNFGAGNIDRVKRTFRLLITCCMIYASAVSVMCAVFPRFFVRIFVMSGTDSADALIEAAAGYLPIFTAGVWMFGAQSSCQSTFLALGQAKISLFLAILRKIILLIPFVYLFSHTWGTIGVFIAEPCADILAASTTLTLFLININKILRGKKNG
jgi:putative MATE family efflux protein